MTRRKLSTKERLRLFTLHNGLCCLCGGKIDGTKERWIIEHVRPLALLGEDDDTNMKPSHELCSKAKTYGKQGDLATIAKAKRREAVHVGAKERGKGFAPPQRNGRASRPPVKWYGWRET